MACGSGRVGDCPWDERARRTGGIRKVEVARGNGVRAWRLRKEDSEVRSWVEEAEEIETDIVEESEDFGRRLGFHRVLSFYIFGRNSSDL